MNTPSTHAASLLMQYADYIGEQQTSDGSPAIPLWILRKPLPGLLVGSTYARSSIVAAIDRLHRLSARCFRAPDRPPTATVTLADGRTADVVACLVRGEPGSLSVPTSVEILSITGSYGEDLDVSDEDFCTIRRAAERAVLS